MLGSAARSWGLGLAAARSEAAMYGWRARIGLIVPSSNTTMEPDFYRMAPLGVSTHTTRVMNERAGTLEVLTRMEEQTESAAALLATAAIDVVVWGCTSGSFIHGRAFNRQTIEKLERKTGVPAVTTAQAMTEALGVLGCHHISVVTPYVEKTNRLLCDFLRAHDIEVLRLETFDMLDQFEHAVIEPWEIYRKARAACVAGADGLFIACTQLRTLEILEPLERDLGIPVTAANPASFWLALRRTGLHERIPGIGTLGEQNPQSRAQGG
jgi:maleate cis-trans isomerase